LTLRDGSLIPGLLAGFLFALEFACLYTGLQYTSASRLTVLLYTSPFWVALFLPIWVRSERLGVLQWLGLVIAFVALALTVGQGSYADSDTHQWLGDALALAAGLTWGLTTITIRASALARWRAFRRRSCCFIKWLSAP
jgi:drug/metabolite transporter (DMT)-like permease